jgi:hypothetical protein
LRLPVLLSTVPKRAGKSVSAAPIPEAALPVAAAVIARAVKEAAADIENDKKARQFYTAVLLCIWGINPG